MKKDAAIKAVQDIMKGARAAESVRLDKLAAALQPWTPEDAVKNLQIKGIPTGPAEGIASRSQSNYLPLILDIYSQAMKVDDYLSSKTKSTASPWQWWQRNRLGAKQTGVHRSALHYGTSYATVLPSMSPGDNTVGAFIRGVSPRQMTAMYGEPMEWAPTAGGPVDDDWPIMALEVHGSMIRLYDEESVHFIGIKNFPRSAMGWADPVYLKSDNFEYIEARAHGVGVCPIVRFRDRFLLDGEEQFGIIEPLLIIQSRIDETVYEMLTSQYWAAFMQRYVMGWLPENEAQAFKQSAADTMFFKEKDVKVGQFDATPLSPYIDSKRSALQDLAAIGQVPAQQLGTDGISNIADATLASLESGKDRKSDEISTSFGESWEQALRTAAHITGDTEAASDFGAEVKWQDKSARAFAQAVDGLGKIAQMLDVPPEALWEDVPGWTKEKVDRIRAIAAARDAGLAYSGGE